MSIEKIPINSRYVFRVVTKFFVFSYILPIIVDGTYRQQRKWKQRIIQEYMGIGNGQKTIWKWIDVAWYDDE